MPMAALRPRRGQSSRTMPKPSAWFRLAAQQGEADAQCMLGLMYSRGKASSRMRPKRLRLYRLAAERGHARAQLNLGRSYANGAGVLKDSVLAHMWFTIAGATGDEAAREQRDTLERSMSQAEISRATELARACLDLRLPGLRASI